MHFQTTATKKLHVFTMICPRFDCSSIFTRGFALRFQKWIHVLTYQAHAERVIFVNTVEQGSQLQIRSLGPFSIELKNLHITIVYPLYLIRIEKETKYHSLVPYNIDQ